MPIKRWRQSGFTLIELNLAILFVSVLVITIAYTTLSVTGMYRKGTVTKAVNQVGREVLDQISRDIAATNISDIVVDETNGVGRICTDRVAYLYNTADRLNTGGSGLITKPSSLDPITFVRVEDPTGYWCEVAFGVYPTQLTPADTNRYVELLQTDLVPLVVHSLSARVIAQEDAVNAKQGLVALDMTLGTNEAGTIAATGICKPPTDVDANFDQCAVRPFSIVIGVSGV